MTTRTFLARLLSVLALAAALTVTALAGSATAQAAAPAGSAAVAETASTAWTGSAGASEGDVAVMADCGFYTTSRAYYNHCGSSWEISIRVNFWYGADYTHIWVRQGITNLSDHPSLQGRGLITNAWCVQNCN